VSPHELWSFLPIGYLFTIAIETPILLLGLSRHHSIKRRLLAGIWLTACTYPIVVLVMPLLLPSAFYLVIAETFAPVAECLLFWAAFGKETRWRDFAVIVVANLASFLIGALIFMD
jgi:hypothetical protein